YIRNKQRLIELLNEQKTAIINRAVTKGINPNVPMKHSGIEWLGEIPVHWEVIPLTKNLSSLVDYRGKTPEKIESGIFLVTAKNIKNGSINYEISKEYISENNYFEIMRRGLPKIGDILFTTEAPLGEVANVDFEQIALAQRIIKFRVQENILNPYFVKLLIMSSFFQNQIQQEATGSTAQGIKASKLHKLKILKTSIDEQEQIVKYIDFKNRETDQAIAQIEKEIELIQEYRTTLISDAVTGKIDVRGFDNSSNSRNSPKPPELATM
ncbi:MAG: restriction endonuclease subunit S, partial [Planktothrix sp.]